MDLKEIGNGKWKEKKNVEKKAQGGNQLVILLLERRPQEGSFKRTLPPKSPKTFG